MIAAAFIVGGYVALIWSTGWIGLAVAAAHIGVMLLAMKR